MSTTELREDLQVLEEHVGGLAKHGLVTGFATVCAVARTDSRYASNEEASAVVFAVCRLTHDATGGATHRSGCSRSARARPTDRAFSAADHSRSIQHESGSVPAVVHRVSGRSTQPRAAHRRTVDNDGLSPPRVPTSTVSRSRRRRPRENMPARAARIHLPARS